MTGCRDNVDIFDRFDNFYASVEGLGPELITNGAFAADTDWTKSAANWTIAGGVAVSDGAQGGAVDIYQDIDEVSTGKTYRAEFDIVSRTAGAVAVLVDGASSDYISSVGHHSVDLKPADVGVRTGLRANADFAGTVDNISVRRA